MSDTKISEAAVEAALARYLELEPGEAETNPMDDSTRTFMRELLEAAIPHLHPQPAELTFDVEAMLTACVPGGSIVDPQVVADNIRGWAAERKPAELAEEQGVWNDSARLACLESWARELGGLLLHAESETGRRGLGLGENCGNRTLAQAIDGCATHAEKDSFAALTATGKQQVGEEVSVEEDVYCSIADMIEPYVQREGINPDGPLPASVHDSVQIIFDHWLKTRAQVGEVQGVDKRIVANRPEGMSSDYVYGWNDCVNALAARQPGAQEPVCRIAKNVNGQVSMEFYGGKSIADHAGATLYAALPAQGIGLGQFRPFVQAERTNLSGRIERCDAIGSADRLEVLQAKARECDRLLALIDQRDAAPGVGNG